MNKVFAKLVEQSFFDESTDTESEFMYTLSDIKMQQFAELIVKECINVIQEEVAMKYKNGGETEDFMAGHYAGSLLARFMIKEHFGIES